MPEDALLTPIPPSWDDLDVFDDHPELHHYTTLAGLRGILSSNTLWATHFQELNDSTELMVIRDPLIAELTASFMEIIRARRRRRLRVDRAVNAVGGLKRAAVQMADTMIRLLYASTLTTEEGLEGVKDLKGPVFITSFCTHTNQPYERDNGLLSQWRAYGGDGGFAIVFDSRGLLELFNRELMTHSYMKLSLNEAKYIFPHKPVSEVFPRLRLACDAFAKALLDGEAAERPSDMFTDFIHAAVSCKHHAFYEEREVRLAVQPATEGWRSEIRKSVEGKYFVPPSKASREVGGVERAVLFEGLDVKLPVKRIIVGPSGKQAENRLKAQELVGAGIPVLLSETPYVDRTRSHSSGGLSVN